MRDENQESGTSTPGKRPGCSEHDFAASNRDGCPILILLTWLHWSCLSEKNLFEAFTFFLVDTPSVYHSMLPWPHGPIFGASMDLCLVRGVLPRWDPSAFGETRWDRFTN